MDQHIAMIPRQGWEDGGGLKKEGEKKKKKWKEKGERGK